MKGPFKKKIISDWWFLRTERRYDGRSGHMYTCPITMTLSMYITRWQNRKTHSVHWELSDNWFHTDDRYEPARIIARKLDGGAGYTIASKFPVWFQMLELNLSQRYNHWRWRRIIRKES